MTEVSASWLRAYHIRSELNARDLLTAIDRPASMPPSGSESDAHTSRWLTYDEGATQDFYDLQALQSNAFATAIGPTIEVRIAESHAWLPARVHLLAHVSGFIVIRFTLDPFTTDFCNESDRKLLRRVERAPWCTEQHDWRIEGREVRCSLRGFQNLVFFALHERIVCGTDSLAGPIEAVAHADGNPRINELCRTKEMSHPFPVTFGAHLSIQAGADEFDQAHQDQMCETVLGDAVADGAVSAHSISSGRVWSRATSSWYLFENQSIDFVPSRPPKTGETSHDVRLVQLLEFSLLRRAALRSVQRDTQRILAERRGVSRRRINEWRLLLATTTDDYVLHDQVSHMLLPMLRHMREVETVRDPALLEEQVRQNIDSFQSRIDLAGESTSTLIGALFAVVAVVIGFSAALKAGAAAWLEIPTSQLQDDHALLSSLIDVGVSSSAFIATWLIIQHNKRRLRPLRA